MLRLLAVLALLAGGRVAAGAECPAELRCAVDDACGNQLVKLCASGPNEGKVCSVDADCGGAACRGAWREYFIDPGDDMVACSPILRDGGAGADGVDLADFDGDGDIDIVTGWEETGVTYLYSNPCNPADPDDPGPCTQPEAVRSEWRSPGTAGPTDVRGGAGTNFIEDAAFADFDLDGKPDGVVTSSEGFNKHVKIHALTDIGTWLGGSLPGERHLYMQARVADINGDGCADVVAGNKLQEQLCIDPLADNPCTICDDLGVVCDAIGALWWWECPKVDGVCQPFGPKFNDNPPDMKLKEWTKRRIDRGFLWIMGIELADMDGDGDLDVLYSDRLEVGWFENRTSPEQGGNLAGWGTPIRIDTANQIKDRGDGDKFPSGEPFRFLAYGDVDGDGLKDVVVATSFSKGTCSGDPCVYCSVDGDCPAGQTCDNAGSGDAGRFAGYFYRRSSTSGQLWTTWPIFAEGGLPYGIDIEGDAVSKGVAIGDVTGNGHNDVVFSVRGAGHALHALSFDPNAAGICAPCGTAEWKVRPIAPCRSGSKYDNVQLADLDRDGRLDVVTSEENFQAGRGEAGSSTGLGVVWYRNLGFCGNGTIDPGEECDLGAVFNGFSGQCCTEDCRFRTGAVCRAATDQCDAEEICQAGSGECPADVNQPVGTPCAAGECDALPYQCNAEGFCEIVAEGIPCEANTDCDTGLCLLNVCAASCPDDGNPCTYDVCNGGLCMHPAKEPGTPCPDDGDPCTVNFCNEVGQCAALDCGEENECRRCAGDGTCTFLNEPDGTPCGNSEQACAVQVCENGVCREVDAPAGTPCPDDDNPCTIDQCSGSLFACVHVPAPEGTPCRDHPDPGNACELQDRCDAGGNCLILSNAGQVCREAVDECDRNETCVLASTNEGVSFCPSDAFAPAISCTDDGNVCTWDVCDGEGACVHPDKDDGTICFGGECTSNTCQEGLCTHEPTPGEPCEPDSNYCTVEICTAEGSCESVPAPAGTLCHVQDWDDSDCTDDVCVDGACVHVPRPAGTPCGRVIDEVCSDPDRCDGAGACSENDEPDGTPCIDDGQACTRDVCNEGVCMHIPIDNALLPHGLCGFEFSPMGGGLSVPAGDLRDVQDFAVFDDGTGTALYAALGGASAGPDAVVRWDGVEWVGTGGVEANVRALAVFDDGSGPALYAAGLFPLNWPDKFSLARWDGASWTNVDPGFCPDSTSIDGCVETLAVFDDGSGPALYVGGRFAEIGETPVNHVVKWDGDNWSSVGALSHGFGGVVYELAVVDAGGGAKLYAGGLFDHAGGSQASGVAVLDFADWIPLGTLSPVVIDPVVRTFALFDRGKGPELFIGGSFGVDNENDGVGDGFGVARWTGAAWTDAGSITPAYGMIFDLFAFDDGTGSALYAGGTFDGIDGAASPFVARYRAGAWEGLNQCVSAWVSAFAAYDDGSGESLIVGGLFDDAGGPDGDRVARWGCTGDNDCNDNFVPDNEEPDCDNSGTPDDCDLLAAGVDCQPNGVLDACELGDGDMNGNGVPDTCDAFHPGDFDADCDVDDQDAGYLAQCMNGPNVLMTPICRQVFDSDKDTDGDMRDWAAFQTRFGILPDGCP